MDEKLELDKISGGKTYAMDITLRFPFKIPDSYKQHMASDRSESYNKQLSADDSLGPPGII